MSPLPAPVDYADTSDKKLLRKYFGEKWGIFYWIANCESTNRQFVNGHTVTSPKNTDGTYDYGYLQINDVNVPEATKLGYDVKNSLEDNIAFASLLYAKKHYQPWVCAAKLGII